MKYFFQIIYCFCAIFISFPANGWQCRSNEMPIEIISRPLPGNRESQCFKQGREFLYVNNHPIYIYRSNALDRMCQNSTDTAAIVGVGWGCIPKQILRLESDNIFTFGITNESQDTYVHQEHTVILNPRSDRELLLWAGLIRKGRWPNHYYNGTTRKSFSYIVLLTNDGSQIYASKRTIKDLIDSLKKFFENFEDQIANLENLARLLRTLASKPLSSIDPEKLSSNIPSWFKSLIRDAQKELDKLKDELKKQRNKHQAEVDELEERVAQELKEQGIAADEIVYDDDLASEFPLELPPEDLASENNFPQFLEQADYIISDLATRWEQRDRIGYLEVVFGWLQNHKILSPILLSRAGIMEGEWEAYQRAFAKVWGVVQEKLDEKLYFRDLPISAEIKNSIAKLEKIDRASALNLKKTLNSVETTASVRVSRLHETIIDISEGILEGENSSFWQLLAKSFTQAYSEIIEASSDAAKCLAKTAVAGVYADYYELRFQRSFCDDTELDTLDLAISATGLGISVATTFFGGPFLGELVRIFQFIKSVFGKVLVQAGESFGKILRALEVGQKIGDFAMEIRRYGPLKKGVLHSIVVGGETVADTFRSGSYFELTLKEPVKVYRVFGGNAKALGNYWSRIKPVGPLQAQLDAALLPEWGNTAAKWAEVTIPAGTKIYEGVASAQYLKTVGSNIKVGQLLGGGNQIYINQLIDKVTWKFTEGNF